MVLWIPLGGDNGNRMLLLLMKMRRRRIKVEKIQCTRLDYRIIRLDHM